MANKKNVLFFLLLEHAAPIEANHRRKEMTEDVRKQVYQALLARSKNGTLGKKDTRIVADQFECTFGQFSAYGSEVNTNLLITFLLWLQVKRRVDVAARQSLLIWNNCATFLSNKE